MAISGTEVVRRVNTWLSRYWPLALIGLSLQLLADEISAEMITVGELVIHSSPGETLRASIPIGLPGKLPLEMLRVRIADTQDYQHKGQARPAILDEMHLALLARGSNRARIQLFAQHAWQGEGFTLLLHLEHPTGQQQASFHVAAIDAGKGTEYIQARRNETLDSLALRLADRHNRSYLHMMYALYQANPQAFYRDNMNNLRSGARLRIPSQQELYRFGDAEAFAAIREHQQRWHDNQPQGPSPSVPQADGLVLDRDPHDLQQELAAVTSEYTLFEAQNSDLRAQLAALEQRVEAMGSSLLEPILADLQHAPSPVPQHQQETGAPATTKRLPTWLFLLVAGLVTAAVLWLHHRHTGKLHP